MLVYCPVINNTKVAERFQMISNSLQLTLQAASALAGVDTRRLSLLRASAQAAGALLPSVRQGRCPQGSRPNLNLKRCSGALSQFPDTPLMIGRGEGEARSLRESAAAAEDLLLHPPPPLPRASPS
eukprot:3938181-Rhodomonas_salina.1